MLKISGEAESPNEGACLRYMMSRYHQKRGVFKIYGERSSPNEGACYRYMVNRNYQIGGRV